MKTKGNRDEFSEEIKRILQERVGNKCSNPGCRCPTSGPHSLPGKATRIGVASHIKAAAKDGPRYDQAQTEAERKSIENAIWLCVNCATLIDKDAAKYPVDLLMQWKKEAEAAAEKELGNRPSSSGKTILWTDLPKRKIDLLGREQELKDLEKKSLVNRRVLLVNGLGGIGKTEVCKQFFMDHYGRYPHAGWVDYLGSLKNSLINAFKAEPVAGQPDDNTEQRFTRIIDHLSRLTEGALLVIDNISQLPAADQDLDLLFALPAAIRVLASSRLSIDGFDIFPLDVLPEEECRVLFYRFYKGKEDDESLAAVITLSGRHTLTVELLARTAHSGKISIKNLLAHLQEKGFDLGAIIPEPVNTYYGDDDRQRPLFEHLEIVFDLSALTEKERHILANLSVLPAIYIPAGDIKDWLGLATNQELNSLIDKGWVKEDNAFNLYLHPVIGEVVRYKERPAAESCRHLIGALAGKLYNEAGDNPLAKQGYVAYGAAVVERLADADEDLAALADNLSTIYQALGQLDQALEFQQKALAIREKVLSADHPDLAQSYNNLSTIYQDLGQLNRALEFQLKALAIREKVLVERHPDLGTSYNDLSMTYIAMGKLDKALEFQLKANDIYKSIFEPNHPWLATAYNNLSLIYKALGQLDQALEFQVKALAIREKVLAADHPSLATSYNNLCTIYYTLGQLDRALEVQLKTLAIREKVLSADHPDLARSYNNLSLIYKDLGQLDQALEYQQKSLAIREKVLAADHPDLAGSYNNLCTIYYTLGQLDRALEFQLKTLAIREKALAADHPDLAGSYNNLSTIYRDMKDLGRARDYGQRAVAILARLFPNGHPHLDIMRQNLAMIERVKP